MTEQEFTEEQKQYLQGFAAGSGVGRTIPLAIAPAQAAPEPAPVGPDAPQRAAQDRFTASGKKLCPEEQAKRNKHGLDMWDEVIAHARDGRFPKGTDVFLFKFQGLFYVAPAQDAFMCRLRFPAGVISSHQLRGVADLSEQFAGGTADVTTRANLQIRQIEAKNTVDLLMGLHDLSIINRGAGADNIRNITASPTAGFDLDELIDTRPLAKRMHHYILNHREMYGLPRKFNIAFDGGGRISALEDTNDIGFVAVKLAATSPSSPLTPSPGTPGGGRGGGSGEARIPPNPLPNPPPEYRGREQAADAVGDGSVFFRMQLGGITGHKDFARDCGILLTPGECVEVAAAVVRVFLEHGDRIDRRKARLKYLLDAWGLEKYLVEVERKLPFKLRRVPLEQCEPRKVIDRVGHVGFHPQKQEGRVYLGVVLPVGRMTAAQMRGIASIAEGFGSGDIRLTVWQNLLIPDLRQSDIPAIQREIRALGLHWSASSVRAGLVACTGSAGCKYAAADTKAHALQIASRLESRIKLDQPVNIHLTGCHHSCAQHYIGDIGLLATKIGEDAVEGYHLHVGGGYGSCQQIAREIFRDVKAQDAGAVIEKLLASYLAHRTDERESFQSFVQRHSIEQLRTFCEEATVNA
jgi:ferredoxin-nitrite reductase